MVSPKRAAARCSLWAISPPAARCCSSTTSSITSRSIAFASAQLRHRGVGDLWTCALLDKRQRREVEVALHFVGFSVADLFVVGHGTDFAERYRHLPFIGVVE
jgi:hypoxanthine phosphoribosyltransferase